MESLGATYFGRGFDSPRLHQSSSTSVAALTPAFQKLGVSGETVGKFLPIVVGYVTKKGGTGVGDILGGGLK